MIDLVQNTIDGVMIGSSYGLLALGFTVIFGVMRRLNLSYGPSIMIGGYLGTLLYLQLRRWSACGGGCRSGRGRACRHLRRAAVFRADESGRRDRVDGVELRHLDAARADSDPGPAAPHLFLPGARDRRAARVLVPADKDRSSHHAGLRAWTSGSRSARALSHALWPRTARHHRQSRCGASRRHRCQDGRAACFRRRVGDRRQLPASSCSPSISRSRRCSGCGRR